MPESSSTFTPTFRWYQWRLSTWFVLVALLGWAFAITPSRIVVRDSIPRSSGKPSVNTLIYVNPHYFAPVFALMAFACWKEISLQRGFSRPTFRRRARQISVGLSLLAFAVAIGAWIAGSNYSAAAVATAEHPDFWARLMAINCSAAFYASLGFAIGLVVALVLSAADHRRPL